MAEYQELIQALTWLLTNRIQQKINYTHGLLGDGNGRVKVPADPNSPDVDFVYARPDRGSDRVYKVFNKRVSGQDGDPIIIGELPWEPGLIQVVDIDWQAYKNIGWGEYAPNVSFHGKTHEWRDGSPGVDTFNVYRRQLGDLRTYPAASGSLAVGVTPYSLDIYDDQYQWPGIQSFPLDGARPAGTGTARMALVYWSTAAGSGTSGYLGVATGTLGVDSEVTVLNRPPTPEGAIPSAFIRLAGGQSSVAETDIFDARVLFRPAPRVSKVWESDFENVALWADADGGIGIGTETIPHGGVGAAIFALDGTVSSIAGPHVQFTTTADDYPTMQLLNWAHDDVYIAFDASFNGTNWVSSDAGSSFAILKGGDLLRLRYDVVAAGGTITWNDGLVMDTSGQVGIGTATPATLLDVSGAGTVATFGDGTSSAGIDFDGAAGSVRDMVWRSGGSARWILRVDSTPESGNDDGSDFIIQSRTDAGALKTSVLQIIRSSGNVGVNISPSAKLHVDQPGTTAAIPVLYLDQADVSEEFIRFVGTAAAATLTQSIVDEGDVTTATRQGWLKVYVQDDGNQITDQDYFIPIYTLA